MAEKPFSVIIADDEPGARAIIRRFLAQHFPEIIVAGEASGIAEALHLLQEHPIDLLFLDIEMKDGTGFELLDRIPELSFNVIFTTAHDEFAVKAFRYNAIDYLLKPIDPDEFAQAVEKALHHDASDILQRRFAQLLKTTQEKSFDRITLATSNGHVFAKTQDITRIETYGNYSFVHFVEGERHLVSKNLKEFEEMLPEPDFFRVHQSHIVNTLFVKKVIKDDGDQVVMADGTRIPVSRRRKEDFMNVVTKINRQANQ
jgi:two-component system LytT family response regulator